MEIEECQNISMREDMETIENILDQVIEARSVVVLSDFSLERQMEIAGEASLEHFEEILLCLCIFTPWPRMICKRTAKTDQRHIPS